MPAQSYKIRDAYQQPGWSRRIRESGGRWCDAERQESLQLKIRIEGWIEQQTNPVLYRQGRRVDPLSQVRFKLDCVVKSLVLNCRIHGMNLRARVLQASLDDFGTVALRADLRGRKEIFEIRPALDTLARSPLLETRSSFQGTVENLIRRSFATVQILKSTVSSDLEHSLSGKYVRLQFRSGGSGWVAIATGPQENQATIDGLLSNGMLWRSFLRERGLAGQDKLLLMGPLNKLLVLKSRLAWISGAGRDIQLMAMDSEIETLTSVDLGDCGNLDTALTQVQMFSDGKGVDEDECVRRVLGLAPEQITWSRSENSQSIAFRIRGLDFAHLRFGRRSKLTFGQGMQAVSTEIDWERLKDRVEQILAEQGIPLRGGNSRWTCRAPSSSWITHSPVRSTRVRWPC